MNDHYPASCGYGSGYLTAASGGASSACEALINLALVGAVVGGSAAGAHNAARLQQGELQFTDALFNTGRAAIASATATAVAGAVAGMVAGQSVLRLSVMFGVSAGVLYGLNHWTEGQGNA